MKTIMRENMMKKEEGRTMIRKRNNNDKLIQ